MNDDSSPTKKPFSVTASRISVLLIVLVFLSSSAMRAAKDSGYAPSPRVSMVLFIVTLLFLFTAVVLGLIALFGKKPKPSTRIFVKSLVGICLGGLFLVIGITNFVKAFRAGRANESQLQQTSDKFNRDLRDSDDGPTNFSKALGEYQKSMEAVANESSGETAIEMKVVAAFTKEVNSRLIQLEKLNHEMDEQEVMDITTMSDISEIPARRDLINQYIKANEELKKFFENVDQFCRAELKKQGLPEKEVEDSTRRFMQGYSSVQSEAIVKRGEASAIARKYLELTDLAEKYWDDWGVEESTGDLVSGNDEFRETYNKLMEEIDVHSERIRKWQEEALKRRKSGQTVK